MPKKAFESLKSKYGLPSWRELDREFEVGSPETGLFLLRDVAKKMEEHLDNFLVLVEHILSPDAGSMTDMYEAQCFSEDDKERLAEVFKRLRYFKHVYTECLLSRNEADEARFINEFFEAWAKVKKDLKPYLQGLQKCWLDTSKKEDIINYLG